MLGENSEREFPNVGEMEGIFPVVACHTLLYGLISDDDSHSETF